MTPSVGQGQTDLLTNFENSRTSGRKVGCFCCIIDRVMKKEKEQVP